MTPVLSIVILNYNTKDLLRNCLASLEKVRNEIPFEVIVSDNGSSDESVDMVRKNFPKTTLIKGDRNLGFAKGNNRARSYVSGKYVLFLNSDTEVKKGTLMGTIDYMEAHPEYSALTCKTLLTDGSLDKDTRRSFPTPWVALTHFSLLDRIFSKSALFSKYWYGFKSPNEVSEIEVLQGAFSLFRKEILDKVDWFDEDYFLDGEDIDLCWKIKEAGGKIIYYPTVSIVHIKGASKDKKGSFGRVTMEERLKFINAGMDSMEIFYRKRLMNKYPIFLTWIVFFGIKTLKSIRYVRALLS